MSLFTVLQGFRETSPIRTMAQRFHHITIGVARLEGEGMLPAHASRYTYSAETFARRVRQRSGGRSSRNEASQ